MIPKKQPGYGLFFLGKSVMLLVMIIVIAFLGLMLGSFTNALVWRVHEQAKQKNRVKKNELSVLKGRSMCPSCRHTLSAKDLVPVVSWVLLKGRCRYCKAKIGWQYPIVELAGCGMFALSYAFWPYTVDSVFHGTIFAVWLLLCVIFLALATYDIKWLTLPSSIVYTALAVGITFTVLQSYNSGDYSILLSGVAASIMYGGFFYILYQLSGGKWIGGGDVRLGFVLGMVLGIQKSVVSLMLASYSACVVILILVILKKYHSKMKLPFGPFLLAASIGAFLWGETIINAYLRLCGL